MRRFRTVQLLVPRRAMATVTRRGEPTKTIGDLPKVGSSAPSFKLTAPDLKTVTLDDFKNKTKILNVFPSVDTPTCAKSVRKFNEEASKLPNTVVLCVSADLPFAASRFCAAEGLKNVSTLSTFRGSFDAYGTKIAEGPLKDLESRAVVVIGADGKVKYTEHVAEIGNEPAYAKAIEAVKVQSKL